MVCHRIMFFYYIKVKGIEIKNPDQSLCHPELREISSDTARGFFTFGSA